MAEAGHLRGAVAADSPAGRRVSASGSGGTIGRPRFGGGIGLLYAVTTISGPPLAVALNNQQLSKQEFRAALSFVRLAESILTAIAYLARDSSSRESRAGSTDASKRGDRRTDRHGAHSVTFRAETFRRVCMSFGRLGRCVRDLDAMRDRTW